VRVYLNTDGIYRLDVAVGNDVISGLHVAKIDESTKTVRGICFSSRATTTSGGSATASAACTHFLRVSSGDSLLFSHIPIGTVSNCAFCGNGWGCWLNVLITIRRIA